MVMNVEKLHKKDEQPFLCIVCLEGIIHIFPICGKGWKVLPKPGKIIFLWCFNKEWLSLINWDTRGKRLFLFIKG